MAEITKKTLVLTFATAGGKTVSLTIAKPNERLTAQEVNEAMDAMIATGAYGDDDLVSNKLEAKYVTQQSEYIQMN